MVSLNLVARLARRSLRRRSAQRRFPSVRMMDMPILFGNSFPKSGTHLLTQILAGFADLAPFAVSGLPPILTYHGESGKQRELTAILSELKRLLPGDIAYGHLHANPEIVAELCKPRIASYFIYRDPRDVVVSHVYYVTDINNRHVHHDYYINHLKTFEERLKTSILGRADAVVSFPDIRGRFEPYLHWLDRKEVLSLKYEDLLSNTPAGLAMILDHANQHGLSLLDDRDATIVVLQGSIKPSASPTFRSGGSGGWKQHFSTEMKSLFKDVSGDLLIRLGYEQDQNW